MKLKGKNKIITKKTLIFSIQYPDLEHIYY